MEEQLLNYERIEKAIIYLSTHLENQPSLEQVAEKVHLSPYHFQKIFTDWAGVSPKKFLQYLSVQALKMKLERNEHLSEAAEAVGLSSSSRAYELFVGIEAVTPATYKNRGLGLQIFYGYHATPFGLCFVAMTERGICGLSFADEAYLKADFEDFSKKWSFAQLIAHQEKTKEVIVQIFGNGQHFVAPSSFRLLVQGTDFQLKVWEALLKIPAGAVSTYQQIAASIGNAKASRAVGSAVADNPIAYLIPCHRVIRKEGKIGEYHWGTARKQAMIGWEIAHCEIVKPQ